MVREETETTDTGVPTNDAYTGMLVISLLALIAGSVLLYMDMSQYSGNPPKASLPSAPTIERKAPQGGAPEGGNPAPQPPQGGAPGVPPPGGAPMPEKDKGGPG
jgi:hypothetical protein